MLKRHKDLLRLIVAELRRTLAGAATADGWARGDLDRELERLGVAPDGAVTPIDALPGATAAERWAHAVVAAQLTSLPAAGRAPARGEIVERAAYTWINRLLALRAMEARGLIDETLRTNPDYDGLSEALFVLRQTAPARAAGPDAGWWAVLDDACAAWREALPGLFDPADPAAALRPSTTALLRCAATVGGAPNGFTLAEADAAVADPDAIGWCYQFYQEAAKARVYEKLGKGGKASTRAEIAAATQLFTEPYMVKWLLQNSLGRSYHELHSDSVLPATWEYYIRELPNGPQPPAVVSFEFLTVMDPCCGSGHFLREAFDLLTAMYRERRPDLGAAEIADRILERHLHGIDLDPRCAQLTALTLWLRAWETVRDEARLRRRPGPTSYAPPAMNVATTPTSLDPGALERHLVRHPGDRPLRPLLEGVFAALEQADILGSLLRPSVQLDEAIAALQRPRQLRMDADPDEATLRQRLADEAQRDPAGLKRLLLERVAASLAAEKGNRDDAAAQLFGWEGEQGVRLLQLLDRQYAVVATNPPYMGSKNMDVPLKRYIEHHYPAGRRDLYAAFLLRCLESCHYGCRVAMVTQQNWMLLQSFESLRAAPREAPTQGFEGLLRATSVEALAHLGSGAFSEITGEVVKTALLLDRKHYPSEQHQIHATKALSGKSLEQKLSILRNPQERNFRTFPKQSDLLALPGAPLVYWLPKFAFDLFRSSIRFSSVLKTKQGIVTGDNDRYLRLYWEIAAHTKAEPYLKGLGYRRWYGFTELCIRWTDSRIRIAQSTVGRVKSPEDFEGHGWSYSSMAQGCMSPREFLPGWRYDNRGPVVFPKSDDYALVGAILASHFGTFLLRSITQGNDFNSYHVDNLPIWKCRPSLDTNLAVQWLVESAKWRASLDPMDRLFVTTPSPEQLYACQVTIVYALTLEAFQETAVLAAYKVPAADIHAVFADTGAPRGFYPLVAGHDSLPLLPANHVLPSIPQEVSDYLPSHERISPDARELARLKERLWAHYEAGPGLKEAAQELGEAAGSDEGDDDEVAAGHAHSPIPPETFLEELSLKLQVHPISVYWLLEELRAEGARCKPEEQCLLEDRLSVLVMRLLGHRWPKQVEASEELPEWADGDGIIPLSAGTGEPTVADRLRARLRAEDGELGAQQTEALLAELTSLSLADWCRRRFSERHVRQFKYRPVSWHLASSPQTGSGGRGRRGGSRRPPAFECLLYYHACGGDVLARIRTQYVEPLLRAARQQADDARLGKDETAAAVATDRIHELDDFAARLRRVEEEGFACADLDALLATEPLDRWAGDGYLAPASREELLHDERAWRVDINDGVRVNIAPLQLAGLLAADVLKAADAKKAIADRARWRSDERRWVREGKLPRCGWLEEIAPESPRWTALAPQREAEALKLEQKRQAALARLDETGRS